MHVLNNNHHNYMNMKARTLLLLVLLVSVPASHAQTFTMGKKCRAALETAKLALENDSYQEALTLYQAFAGDCKTKDAKEQEHDGKQGEQVKGKAKHLHQKHRADKRQRNGDHGD